MDSSARPALLATLSFPVIACLVAAAWVFRRDGLGSGDIPLFAALSVMAALPLYALAALVHRVARRRSLLEALGLTCMLGVLYPAVATIASAFLIGPWFGAFSFPIVACWIVACLYGLAACVALSRGEAWTPSLLSATGCASLALIGLWQAALALARS